MRPVGLAGLMLALALAMAAPARAQAAARQWDCQGSAKGQAGSMVQVDLYVEADGRLVAAAASWDPPRIERAAHAAGLDEMTPELTVLYDQATAAGLGAPMDVMASAGGDARRLRFEGMTATLAISEGAGHWQADLQSFPALELPDGQRVGFASGFFGHYGSALLKRISEGAVAEMTLAGAKGEVLATARFDASATAERDALFGKAWAEAAEKAKAPTKCIQTQAGPLPDVPVT